MKIMSEMKDRSTRDCQCNVELLNIVVYGNE